MEQSSYYCPKCGKPLTVFEDNHTVCCTECSIQMQIINGALCAGAAPNPAFSEESRQMNQKQWKKRILAGISVPVIWALTCILFAVFKPEVWVFLSPFALIGALLSLPSVMYACGVFEKQKTLLRIGGMLLSLPFFLMGVFSIDFVCRLILDIVIYI